MAFLLPGFLLIAAFAIYKGFFVAPDVAVSGWFVLLSFLILPVCVVLPAIAYYLTTPPGIDHK